MEVKPQTLKESNLLVIFFILFFQICNAQNKTYKDSIITYQQNYTNTHEVVSKADRKYIHFYDIDQGCRVKASFERIKDKKGFEMNTSSGMKKQYFVYGLLSFKLHDCLLHLYVYQSKVLMQQKKYRDYLFVPFWRCHIRIWKLWRWPLSWILYYWHKRSPCNSRF